MKFILLTFILYHTRLTSVEARDDMPGIRCCLKVSNTRVQIGDILDYDIQNAPPCNIVAIRFHTKKDKTVCSDPGDNWSKWAMREIDARTTTKPTLGPPKCITSTSTRIPTTSIKTPGPETKTSSRTVTSISSAPSTVSTLKTTRLRTKIWTMSTKTAKVSTETSQSPLSYTTPGPETKSSSRTVTSKVTTFKELPVQDFKQNFGRNLTKKTNEEELFTTRTEPMEHTQHSYSQTTEIFCVNELPTDQVNTVVY